MRVLVCGGRDFTDSNHFWDEMNRISEERKFDENQPIVIIAGEARGADTLAREYAEECGFMYEPYPARWAEYGKAAGYIRNVEMLERGKPDLVIAFPGGKGTAMMVKIARDAGVEVYDVQKS